MQGHGHDGRNMRKPRFLFNPFRQQGTQEPPDAGTFPVLELMDEILERPVELETGKRAVEVKGAARAGRTRRHRSVQRMAASFAVRRID
jgi:hypothetical protein